MDAGNDVVALACLDDLLLRLHDGRVGLIEPRFAAEREAEIRRAHVDGVHTGRRQNRVEVLERLGRLDHRHHDDVFVGALRVVAARVNGRAHRTERAIAERRILARGDQRLGLRARVDHGADDAVRTGVEDLHQTGGIVPRHARQWDDARR